jgi:DNA-binding XRE family transcriptional regulator
LFAFDPWRSSVLLVAGDKSGRWQQRYREAIPRAGALTRPTFRNAAPRRNSVTTKRWAEVRDKHVAAADAAEVEAGKNRLLSAVRANKLAELRRRRGLTQRQVAQIMGVTVGRVSQIESGELAGIDVLDRYVTALGGDLQLIANFGDEQIKVG